MTAVIQKSPLLHSKSATKSALRLAFVLGALGALGIFLPFLVVDKGFFLYCGDYNEQQIPFYMYVNHFLKTAGGGTWSWATDMGSSVVTGYAFYNLGSPFLWLSLIVPSRWMPFAMVPLFMLKFGCIAAAACLYLSRYAKNRNMLVIASVVFSFSGFNVYNIFFNHMLDPVAIFPLMLWALDEFMYSGRRGAFAFLVGLALVDSYFFFLGNVTFILIYFFVKLACKEYTITAKKFGLLFFEAVLGVGLGMVLALPSFLNLIGNPRTDNFASGLGLVMYSNVQQYFNILKSLFLPPDSPYLPYLFTEGVIKWSSMSFFLPVVSLAGVWAYCRARRGGSVKIILFICLVMALVPVLNSAFYAFNASYYARWYYMPLLMASMATMYALQDETIRLNKGVHAVLGITLVFGLFGLLPTEENGEWTLGVVDEPRMLWLIWLIGLLGIVIFAVVVHFARGGLRFGPLLLGAVMGFSVFYGVVHIAIGKFPQWERDATYRARQWDGTPQVHLPPYSEGFYRIDTYEAHDNLGLWLDRSSIRTFNSTVNTSIMEFYPLVGVKRDVSSKPELENYALRGLLSVRYTLMPQEEQNNFLGQSGVYGWAYQKTEGPFAIYENENFVPLGFTYDQYLRMDYLKGIQTGDRAALLMRGIGLTAEQEGRFAHLFSGMALNWEITTGNNPQDVTSGWYQYDPVTFTAYEEDCARRAAAASYASAADAHGFRVNILLEKENLVFFGVPYDEGFTATVNGEKAEVLKVSGGMMAVLAPAGDNEIVFSYRTPGLRLGIIISLVCLAILVLYVLLCRTLRKKQLVAGRPDTSTIGVIQSPVVMRQPGRRILLAPRHVKTPLSLHAPGLYDRLPDPDTTSPTGKCPPACEGNCIFLPPEAPAPGTDEGRTPDGNGENPHPPQPQNTED